MMTVTQNRLLLWKQASSPLAFPIDAAHIMGCLAGHWQATGSAGGDKAGSCLIFKRGIIKVWATQSCCQVKWLKRCKNLRTNSGMW